MPNLFHGFVPRRGQCAVPGPAAQDGAESDESCENARSSNRNHSPPDSISSALTFPATCQGRFLSFGLYCALNSHCGNKFQLPEGVRLIFGAGEMIADVRV